MNLIKSIRKASGMSQAEFAEQIGVTQSAVSQYERDETVPGIKQALKIVSIGRRFKVRVRVEDICLKPELAKEPANA
ncbi:hypothetical protein CDEF62S_00375 [Castellaniella defragrans]